MLHIFDIDFTIYNGSTVRDFLIYRFLRGKLPLSVLFALPFLTLVFLLGKGSETVKEKQFRFLKGISRNELYTAAVEIFHKKTLVNLNPDIIKAIHVLKKNNEKIALATSSFHVLVEPLAEYLMIDLLFATQLEYSNGITTGRLLGTPLFGEGKKEVIEQFLKKENIGREDCTFYTDSHRDLPLLNIVGKPVAVNPDRILSKTARLNKWEIYKTKRK